jgi:hypothetical protein
MARCCRCDYRHRRARITRHLPTENIVFAIKNREKVWILLNIGVYLHSEKVRGQ